MRTLTQERLRNSVLLLHKLLGIGRFWVFEAAVGVSYSSIEEGLDMRFITFNLRIGESCHLFSNSKFFLGSAIILFLDFG